LLEREVSGKGQWVTTSLLQAQIFMLDFQAARWVIAGEVPGQAGNNHPTSIPTGVFKTSDGHINIAASGQVIYARLCEAIGAPELVTSPDFANGKARSKNRDKLNVEIEKRMARRTSAEWVDILNKAGVPSGPIYAINDVFADAQVQHLGVVEAIPRAGDKPLNVVGQPVRLSRTPSKAARVPPGRGEHNTEILAEFGFSKAEIAALQKSGAL
jgi:crotonobetainyl-CoA:carnitine CoA-transferase CaiB-like acyl-CoA transferase